MPPGGPCPTGISSTYPRGLQCRSAHHSPKVLLTTFLRMEFLRMEFLRARAFTILMRMERLRIEFLSIEFLKDDFP
eukprot:3949268-Pyramimonas_sp.AAC.1